MDRGIVTAAVSDIVTEIARDTLNVPTLRSRGADSLDFHTVSVWQIERALQRAYTAGQMST